MRRTPAKSDKYKWHNAYYFVDEVVLEEVNDFFECACNSNIINEFSPLVKEKCKCDTVRKMELTHKMLPVNIFYETSKYNIGSDDLSKLDSLIIVLNTNKNFKAIIYGYADEDGTVSTNRDLSFHRAGTVATYFISHGIEKERVSFYGNGSVASDENEETKRTNRKVEILILE